MSHFAVEVISVFLVFVMRLHLSLAAERMEEHLEREDGHRHPGVLYLDVTHAQYYNPLTTKFILFPW